MLEKINSLFIDMQLKKCFKPKHKKEKICMYCKENINEKQYGFWVDRNGNTQYTHIGCEEKHEKLINTKMKEICDVYKWNKKPSIERCLNCYKLEQCKKEQQAINEKVKELRLDRRRR